MDQVQVEMEKSGKIKSSSWGLRETLLACILPALEHAESKEEAKRILWSDADLRGHLKQHRTNCLVAQKKISYHVPEKWKITIKEFLEEFLSSGGKIPC